MDWSRFDSLIHLQDSQTFVPCINALTLFDSLIHLQDSQTTWTPPLLLSKFDSLIHLQDSQTHMSIFAVDKIV